MTTQIPCYMLRWICLFSFDSSKLQNASTFFSWGFRYEKVMIATSWNTRIRTHPFQLVPRDDLLDEKSCNTILSGAIQCKSMVVFMILPGAAIPSVSSSSVSISQLKGTLRKEGKETFRKDRMDGLGGSIVTLQWF